MTQLTASWLTDPATLAVCRMLEADGKQSLFVGGCVRNALLGAPVADIDIATDARPDRVVALAEQAGLKAVPTGIDHGTITVVSGHKPFEITTFRRDVQTDGRRAVVAFSDRIEDDAARRDFTMNALYARSDGAVLDPLGGLTDLQARRVRFIGDAGARLREDYLRSLRFFRFHAWYGDPDRGMDPEALEAIAQHLDGLETLSRERVGAESVKLLSAPDPAPSVAAMRMTGAMMRLWPGADDTGLAPLAHIEADRPPNPLRRLAVLGDADLARGMRLSRAQCRTVAEIRAGATDGWSAGALGYRLGAARAHDAILVRAALLGQRPDSGDFAQASAGATAQFPVTARDLTPELQGPELGKHLKKLETLWIESGFALTRAQLLAYPHDFQG